MQPYRYNEPYPLRLHFPELCHRYALLYGEQVYCINSVSLIQYLPPAVLTGGFNPQHA
jgi:hypothetical protein